MLHFILGPARSGKTSRILEEIEWRTALPEERILLIVPEQFTFETEKKLFRRLGGEAFRRVTVTSFTRFAENLFKEFGGIAGSYAEDPAKAILMSLALEELGDRLELYSRSARYPNFVNSMLQTVAEFKNAGVSPEELNQVLPRMEEGGFREKLSETALIYAAYQALLERSFRDPLDNLSRALALLQDKRYFAGYTVYFDEFKSFTAGENRLIQRILSEAKEVIFSLCLDPDRANGSPASVFSSVQEVYLRLIQTARKLGVRVASPMKLDGTYFRSEALRHLEQHLLTSAIPAFSGEVSEIRTLLCKHEYEEVDTALSEISRLVREEGFRYAEIALVSRDLAAYQDILNAAFPKYGIPFTCDQPSPVLPKPLFRFVRQVLSCGAGGFSTERVLALLKTGMTVFSVEEIAEFENYLFIWEISGSRFLEPFTAHPRGFQQELNEEDEALLGRVNRLREGLIPALERFREILRQGTVQEACGGLFTLLEELEVPVRIEQLAAEALAAEDFGLAQEYGQVWDLLIGLLNTLVQAAGERRLSPERFEQLFLLGASGCELGSLPQAVDSVIVGSADRIRIMDKRAVLVLGVNENVLPCVPAESGVFTDREREALSHFELELSKSSRDRLKEERFVAYKTLTSPSERLFLTARCADISGKLKTPSILFPQLRRMFGEEIRMEASALPGEFFCRSRETAFAYLARTYLDDTPLTASLKAALLPEEEYAGKLAGLDRVLEERDFRIENRANAVRLFGREMNLSPTRVEVYSQCPFRYFMEQGMRAYPLKKAELNPLETGVLIHHILYCLCRELDLGEGYDESQARALVRAELEKYLEGVMGGSRDKTSRFLYLYNRLERSVLKLAEQLHQELLQSLFQPCGFEYEIREDTEIPPLCLRDEDGTVVRISGKIDRIDAYTNGSGERCIRIVDYKSGRKQFKLNDVLYGLNLQMLIYQECIRRGGREFYAGTRPAGILYLPAGEGGASLGRDAAPDEIEREQRKSYTMSGLLLQDPELLRAMDTSMEGLFIPVQYTKGGDFTAASKNSLVTLEELGQIGHYIDRLVLQMARELHEGRVEALPLPDSCDYCSYRAVCGRTPGGKVRPYLSCRREEIFEEMRKDSDGGDIIYSPSDSGD